MNCIDSKFKKCVLFLILIFKLLDCESKKLCRTISVHPDKHQDLVVKVHSGKVKGILQLTVSKKTEYFSFKGIPYAEPPIGKARFLPPVDVKPWTKTLTATEHGNVCPQMKNYIYGDMIGDENCLFINVYSPKKAFKKPMAVMVWIHGGGFIFGSGDSDIYGPDFLLDNDVIIVTFNYRLGAPGFMNLGNSQIPGNAGLKDQNLALKWVKRNIENFGGNPDQITIFGQSAGAVSVDLHLISKMSEGLFSKSIALSGSLLCQWAFTTDPTSIALKLAKNLGETSLDIPKLTRRFIYEDIAKLTIESNQVFDLFNFELNFVPSLEIRDKRNNTFLDKCIYDKLEAGDFHKGHHISGFTSTELNLLGTLFEMASKNMPYVFSMKLKALGVFFSRSVMKQLSYEMFDKPINEKLKIMKNYSVPQSLYYYVFDYEENGRLIKEGTTHAEDLKYIFYIKKLDQDCESKSVIDKDIKIRNKFVKLLTNFAKHGKPSLSDDVLQWRAFNEKGKFDKSRYLIITKSGSFKMADGEPLDLKKETNETIAAEGVLGKKKRDTNNAAMCQRTKLNAADVFDYGTPQWSPFPWLKSIGKYLYSSTANSLTPFLTSNFMKNWFSRNN